MILPPTFLSSPTPHMRELVTRAHYEIYALHNTGSIERHFSRDFIGHSPHVRDGLDGLFWLLHKNPAMDYKLSRVLVDGDLVALHGRYTGRDAQPLVGFDIYRVEDGLIVEHWDGLVPEAPPNASGRSQLDGTTEPARTQDREANRALVTEFFKRALIDGDYAAFNDYCNGEHFHQHSPDIEDGADAVIRFLYKLREDGQPLHYDRIHRTVADGDFVLTHSEGSIFNERHAYFELWRVQDGKIAELWDAIMPVPHDRGASHPNGIF